MQNSMKLVLLLTVFFPVLNWAYTSAEAEDAFFWHYAHMVFQEPSPVPPGDSAISGEGTDFGLFFVNTNKWDSFWAMGGVGPFVWGADWFTDKQIEPHYTPFSQDYESTGSARWIFAYNSVQTFGLPWNFQAGTHMRLGTAHYVTGAQMREHPELLEYTKSPKMQLSLGFWGMSKFETKNFESNLQWVPGVAGWKQPAMGALDMGVRIRKFLAGPTTAWRTIDSASAFTPGFQVKQSIFDGYYSIKVIDVYRQKTRILDYTAWANALGDAKAYSINMDLQTPIIFPLDGSSDGAGLRLNGGYWNSQQDGYGWKAGMSWYFIKELHMDLGLAYNDWSQDPVVGRTGGYKFTLSYYN